jgi:hypothetical protein
MIPSLVGHPGVPSGSVVNDNKVDLDLDFNDDAALSSRIALNNAPVSSNVGDHQGEWPATFSNVHVNIPPRSRTPPHRIPERLYDQLSDLAAAHADTLDPKSERQKPGLLGTHLKELLYLGTARRVDWDALATVREWMPNSRTALFKPDHASAEAIHFVSVSLSQEGLMLLFKGFDIRRQQCFDVLVQRRPDNSELQFDFSVVPHDHEIYILSALRMFVSSPRRGLTFRSWPAQYQVLWLYFKAYIERVYVSVQYQLRCEVGEIITRTEELVWSGKHKLRCFVEREYLQNYRELGQRLRLWRRVQRGVKRVSKADAKTILREYIAIRNQVESIKP